MDYNAPAPDVDTTHSVDRSFVAQPAVTSPPHFYPMVGKRSLSVSSHESHFGGPGIDVHQLNPQARSHSPSFDDNTSSVPVNTYPEVEAQSHSFPQQQQRYQFPPDVDGTSTVRQGHVETSTSPPTSQPGEDDQDFEYASGPESKKMPGGMDSNLTKSLGEFEQVGDSSPTAPLEPSAEGIRGSKENTSYPTQSHIQKEDSKKNYGFPSLGLF